jgi:hypothetical protein
MNESASSSSSAPPMTGAPPSSAAAQAGPWLFHPLLDQLVGSGQLALPQLVV